MSSRLKKAQDARAWIAERLLSARIAYHAAQAARAKAERERDRCPDDELALRRAAATAAAAADAEREWDRVDGNVQLIANAGGKPT